MAAAPSSPHRVVLQALDSVTAADVLAGRRHAEWTEGYPTDGDRDIARLVGEQPEAKREEGAFVPHQILLADVGLVVGGIGCHRPPDGCGSVEIGYGIAPEWRNQGLTTEAVALLVERLAGAGVRKVTARTRPDNKASHQVLLRTGFVTDESVVAGFWLWSLPL